MNNEKNNDDNRDDQEDLDINDETVELKGESDESRIHQKRSFRSWEGMNSMPPKPPRPPRPPRPPKVPEVIGIRGLDYQNYKIIAEKAREQGKTISELLNEIIDLYLVQEEGYIGNIDSLDISLDDLNELDENIKFYDIKRLTFSSDIDRSAFKKIKEIRNVDQIFIPPHLYLLTVKIAHNCGKIEKYSSDTPPTIITKSFDGDISLPRDFFQIFLERGEKINLKVYGDLSITSDVSLDEFRSVIHSLSVDGDIHVPKSLIGSIYAIGTLYREVYEIE